MGGSCHYDLLLYDININSGTPYKYILFKYISQFIKKTFIFQFLFQIIVITTKVLIQTICQLIRLNHLTMPLLYWSLISTGISRQNQQVTDHLILHHKQDITSVNCTVFMSWLFAKTFSSGLSNRAIKILSESHHPMYENNIAIHQHR